PDPQKRHAVHGGDDRPSLGPADALVTVVVFSDFQCPFCADLAPVVHALPQRHDDVRVVFRQLPLPNHPMARPAALAALAADRQGKFWEMHDALFERRGDLDDDALEDLAEGLGLDLARFAEDRADPALEQRVQQDEELAGRAGVRGTPASFVNGHFLGGAQSAEGFDAVIEQERKAAQALVDAGTPPGAVLERLLEQEGS
ncbi:MAG: DsbA family protein, partial [Myxococcales bacterium]|nr:DsbA family protein [Myxococcales bacterium]